MFKFMKNPLLAFAMMVLVLSITACNEEQKQEEYKIIKTVAEDAANVVEPLVDTELKLPIGTTATVVNAAESVLEPKTITTTSTK